MTKDQEINLIWKHTHRDYRGHCDGAKSILINRQGATCLVPIWCLTAAEFEDKLEYAKRKEAKR